MIHFLFLKWMKDSRGKHAKVDGDENEYPCIKVFSTVDAPIEDVSEYLSEVSHMEQYNDLVMAHRDLEEISPHSKICWSQCPQILFIKASQLKFHVPVLFFIICILLTFSNSCCL
jgi:hypothetical protein